MTSADCPKPESPALPAPKLLAVILDRDKKGKLEDILREKRVFFHVMMNGMGTANSEVLKTFGLSGSDKTICVCVEPAARVRLVMTSVVERLEFVRPGHGIAFIMPVSGICSTIAHALNSDSQRDKERWAQHMDTETGKSAQEAHGQLVVAVVNNGFSDVAMQAARSVGARGGTILHGRHSDVEEDVKFFGISLQSEKEVLAIVVKPEQKKELMQAINKACGARSEAHGIVFSVPVESYAGIEMDSGEKG